MTNMSIQPLWLTYFIEILLVLEFQLTKTYFGMFSYKAHFRPQISSNVFVLCGVPFSFYLFSSFCVYVGRPVVLSMVLQVVDFQVAGFPTVDLHWAKLH